MKKVGVHSQDPDLEFALGYTEFHKENKISFQRFRDHPSIDYNPS